MLSGWFKRLGGFEAVEGAASQTRSLEWADQLEAPGKGGGARMARIKRC